MKFVIDNIFLIAVAFVSGAMLIWPLVRRGAGGPSVNTLEATQLINRQDALVLDVREQAEYAQSHILNARGLPLSQLEEVARVYREAFVGHRPPRMAVAEHFTIGPSTAATWISKARAQGFLGPTTKGHAGGIEPPKHEEDT